MNQHRDIHMNSSRSFKNRNKIALEVAWVLIDMAIKGILSRLTNMFWDCTVEYLQAMTKLAKEGEGDYVKANLLSKDFWFGAKELKNQEGFDEVLALVNKGLLDRQD